MEIKSCKVFVIIVTYKGKQWYDMCFQSLRTSSIPVQTIVVDNASNDGSIEYIRTHFPEVHIIESRENLGFGRANNLGIRYALDQGCDYVFLLNQDAWIEPETLERLITIHQNHQEYGIVSPIHLNAEKDAIEKGLLKYLDDWSTTDSSLFNDLFFHRGKDIYESKYVNAAAWLLPRRTLETVGGFDPVFYHYGEDDNYMQRVHFHKMKIGVCPEAKVVHDTVRRLSKNVKKALTENRTLLVEVTDINNPLNLFGRCAFHFRKALTKLVVFKVPQAKNQWRDFLFIVRNRKGILRSRSRNIEVGPNWL